MDESNNVIEIYGDGGCNNKTGVGGFGTAILYDNEEYFISEGYENTTNNRMELRAIIEGLKQIGENNIVTIYSDSQYVTNQYNRNWIKNWEFRGFTGIANPDLVKELKSLVDLQEEVEFIWVKGHSGNEYNEICDELATEAQRKSIKKVDVTPYNNVGLTKK